MVYKFFDKKSSGSGIANKPNYQLANELHKPIIRKFKERKVYLLLREYLESRFSWYAIVEEI